MTQQSRSIKTARLLVLLLTGAFGVSRLHAEEADSPDLAPLVKAVKKLVEKHYPQGKVSLNDQTIHFEFNTRKFFVHEQRLTGEWQDAFEDTGPQKGGIYGDLELRAGEYDGMAAVPQSFDKRYFTLLLLAPYSKKLNRHLYVHLKYPHNAPAEFLSEFAELVNHFDDHLASKGR
jgi:hypothetical protein